MLIRMVPLIGGCIRKIDSDTKKHGIQAAMRNFARKSGTRMRVTGLEGETLAKLNSEPVLLISTHKNFSEPAFIFAAIPDREDAFIIITSELLGIAENVERHFIPVHISNNLREEGVPSISRGILRLLYRKKPLSGEEEHRRNRESIMKASGTIRSGGLVMMFPARPDPAREWYRGIGHLLCQVGRKKAYIINAKVNGTSRLDVLRTLPGIGRLLPEIRVSFSKPENAAKYATNPKDTAAAVERQYGKWAAKQ